MPYGDDAAGKVHNKPEVDDIPDLDLYLNAEMLLPKNGEHIQAARVVGRSTGGDGKPIGEYNRNPILDTRIYNVMFPDGMIQQYAENLTSKNIYSKVNEEGYRYIIIDKIIDYR